MKLYKKVSWEEWSKENPGKQYHDVYPNEHHNIEPFVLVPIEDQWISVESVKKLIDDSNERYNQLQQYLMEYSRDEDKYSATITEIKQQIIGMYILRLQEILQPSPNTDNKL